MYAHIRGMVDTVYADRAVIEAGGVGYELICSSRTLDSLVSGKEAKLLTHFHIAEGVMALYGFATEDERAMFRRLISVTRVGPKLALSVLGKLTVSDIVLSILTENAAAFDPVPGMGRKTAARVLLELKEKLSDADIVSTGMPAAEAASIDTRTEAIAALVALGYDGATAGRAVAKVGEEYTKVEDIITAALRAVSKGL